MGVGVLFMLGKVDKVDWWGEALSFLLRAVVVLVVAALSKAFKGFDSELLVTWEGVRGLLLGCDRVVVMLGDVVIGGAIVRGVGREVKLLSCCFSLSWLP